MVCKRRVLPSASSAGGCGLLRSSPRRRAAAATPRVRRGPGTGGRRTQTMKSPLGNSRTVPCVPRPPHHVGTVSLCQRWWWQSLRCEGWWDGETPQPRTRGTGLAAPWWQQGRSRTPTGTGDGSVPQHTTGRSGTPRRGHQPVRSLCVGAPDHSDSRSSAVRAIFPPHPSGLIRASQRPRKPGGQEPHQNTAKISRGERELKNDRLKDCKDNGHPSTPLCRERL